MASVFDPRTPTCNACSDHNRCARLSVAVLKHVVKSHPELQSHHDLMVALVAAMNIEVVPVSELMPVATVAAPAVPLKATQLQMTLTPDQISRLNGLPVRVEPKVRVLMQRGIDARARRDIVAKRNPFPKSPYRYMWEACDQLLRGGFTRGGLAKHFQNTFGYSSGTAASHVSSAVSIFKCLQITNDTPDGKLVPIQA